MSTHSRPTSTSPGPKEKPHHRHHHHGHHDKIPDEPVVPWFPSPMEGWNEETKSFSPRHEASTIELFFDLWFVANLATFTQYHAITNRYNFWSYVAFFIVLWTSWFHVVCFDARFTSDSVWERACKTVHFCSFAAFALAGYKFMPVARDVQSATPHWIYRTLCFAILLSRACLAFQYIVTAIMCTSRKHRQHRLMIPLALNALLFLLVAGVFGGLFGGFHTVDKNLTGVLIGAYVTLIVELLGTLVISMSWQKLSFTATHIGERLGLLGLIIIGEGVIGTSKTIVRTMGKNGPTWGSSAQIFCIVLILVFMWILYFDKVPRYRFGAVKQQVWMTLHLFLHLGILGVVEGAQQLAQARYIYYSSEIMVRNAMDSCITNHLNGSALASSLTDNINYFKLNESSSGTLALNYVWQQVYLLGNTSDVCSPANITAAEGNALNGLPLGFYNFTFHGIGAMFQAFDIDIPPEDGSNSTLGIALRSWIVVYTYFWSAIMLLLACYTITALLAEVDDRGQWRSLRHYFRLPILSRAAMIILAAVLLALGVTSAPLYLFVQYYIASSWILPTVVLALWVICMSDRAEKLWVKRREGKARYVSVEGEEGETGRDEMEMGGLRRRGTNLYGYPAN